MNSSKNCEECESRPSTYYCKECSEYFCSHCNDKMHRKGTRLLHKRDPIIIEKIEKSEPISGNVRSSYEQFLKNMEIFKSASGPFPFFSQPINPKTTEKISRYDDDLKRTAVKEELNEKSTIEDINSVFQKLNMSMQEKIQKEQLSTSFGDGQTNQSVLVSQSFMEEVSIPIAIPDFQILKVSKCETMKKIQELLRELAENGELLVSKTKFEELIKKKLNKENFNFVIEEAVKGKIIQIISRKFGDSKPLIFVSMLLDNISLQSLEWVIKSLLNDELTPIEKNITSRIKEAYGVKINQITWQGIILYLQNKADSNGIIKLNEKPIIIFHDDNNGRRIGLVGQKSICEDIGIINEKDDFIWKEFVSFLDEFFKEKIKNTNKFEKAKWSSSVQTLSEMRDRKNIVLPPKCSSKAIPGGKYGCAQLVKCCGPSSLTNLSLGKLSLLAQEAINRKVIDYYKTLLIKPAGINNKNNVNFEEQIKHKKELVKKTIYEILSDPINSINGVNLAKLPIEIKKKLNFDFDLFEMGFSKLKSLLIECPDVAVFEKENKKSYAKIVHSHSKSEISFQTPNKKNEEITNKNFDSWKDNFSPFNTNVSSIKSQFTSGDSCDIDGIIKELRKKSHEEGGGNYSYFGQSIDINNIKKELKGYYENVNRAKKN